MTVGHSIRSQDEFTSILKSFDIEVLVDVRRFPGSKKYPQFNADALKEYLAEANIIYLPLPSLGGRRKPRADSKNLICRNSSFRGYADYTETKEFSDAIQKLTSIAAHERVAYMCSEALWWRCHRAIISDYLKDKGSVLPIMKAFVASERPYTSAPPAKSKSFCSLTNLKESFAFCRVF